MILSHGQGLAIMRIAFGGYFLAQGFNKSMTGWLATSEPLLKNQIGPASSAARRRGSTARSWKTSSCRTGSSSASS